MKVATVMLTSPLSASSNDRTNERSEVGLPVRPSRYLYFLHVKLASRQVHCIH